MNDKFQEIRNLLLPGLLLWIREICKKYPSPPHMSFEVDMHCDANDAIIKIYAYQMHLGAKIVAEFSFNITKYEKNEKYKRNTIAKMKKFFSSFDGSPYKLDPSPKYREVK